MGQKNCFENNPDDQLGLGGYYLDQHGSDDYKVAKGKVWLGYDISNNQAEYEGLEGAPNYMNDNDISCMCSTFEETSRS